MSRSTPTKPSPSTAQSKRASAADAAGRSISEDALRKSQERLQSVVTGAPVILFALDQNGIVTLSEGKGLESLGIKPGELVGASVYDLYADRPDILDSARRAIAGEAFTEVVDVGGTILETRWTPVTADDGSSLGTIGVSTDITDRRQAEEKLQQFRALIDQANDAIYVIDPRTGGYLDFNSRAYEILGYSAEELSDLAIFNVALHVPDLAVWLHRVELVEEQGGLVFETSYRKKDGSILPVEVSARMLSHEKRRYMVAAVRDLSERKRTEGLLNANRAAATHFLEQLVTLQKVTNELSKAATFDELCREAVELARTRLGFERSGIWFSDAQRQTLTGSFGIDEQGQLRDERGTRLPIADHDQVWHSLQEHDLVVKHPEAPLYNHLHEQVGRGTVVTGALWDGDEIIGFIATDNLLSHQDFSDQQCELLGLYASALGHLCSRKRTEEALRANEERYRALYRDNPTMYFTLDADAKVTSVNEFGASQLGYSVAELVGEPVLKVFYELDHPEILQQFKTCLENPGRLFEWQFRKVRKDGSVLWVEEFARAVRGPGDSPNVLVVCHDITDRKRAELALGESEALYRRAIESAGTVPYYLDRSTSTYRFMGAGVESIVGYPAAEITPAFWSSLVLERVLRGETAGMDYQEALRRTKNGEFSEWKCDNLIRTRSGELRWIADFAVQILNEEGKAVAAMGILQDITDRKSAADTLQKTEEKYRNIFDNILEGIYQTTPEGEYITANPALARMLGYDSPEDLLAGVTDLNRQIYVVEGRRAEFKDLVKRMGSVTAFESEIRTKAGRTIWVSENGHAVQDDSGKLIFYEGTIEDITERKMAEAALHKAEEKYRNIFDNISEGIYQTTPEGQYITANPALARMLGYDSPEDLTVRITDLNRHFYVQPRRRAEFKELIGRNGTVTGFESEIYSEDGSTMWISENAHGVQDQDGRLLYYEGTTEDITARKRAEEALRRAEEKFRSIFENAVEGIYQTTPDGKILNVNPALARILGYGSAEEMVAGISDIPHQYYVQPGLREYFSKLIVDKGQVFGLEYQAYRKDGSKIWVSDNARAVYSEDEPRLYFEGFITDITERKLAEEKIERQLRRLASLHAIDTAISSSLELHFTLRVLLEQVTSRLGLDAADVLLLDPDTLLLEFAAGSGFRTDAISQPHLPLDQDQAGRAVLERQVVLIPNLMENDALLGRAPTLPKERFVAYCGVPLISKGRVKGVLEIFQRSPLLMDREWLDFLETLAGQTALAIDDAALFQDLQHSNIELTLAYDATIEGWSRALDLRDRETEGHTKRVTETTLRLARALGLNEADLVHIRRGALLHDIGKMGIPDAILSKPGPLSEKEQAMMREHPKMAYEMLLPITFLRPALDIPYCHHEKWAGDGYPRGLKGEEIPMAARIFAVVDVWDALRSDRPYRKRWSESRVRKHLQSQAGRYFDPRIVEAFLDLPGT